MRENTVVKSGLRYSAYINGPESIEWCRQSFGEPGPLTSGRWAALQYTIQFRDRKDRDWYQLRWS